MDGGRTWKYILPPIFFPVLRLFHFFHRNQLSIFSMNQIMARGMNLIPPTHPLIPTDTIEEAEPLLPQIVTPMSPLATAPIQLRPSPINKPNNWNEMSANAQRRWWQIQKHKK